MKDKGHRANQQFFASCSICGGLFVGWVTTKGTSEIFGKKGTFCPVCVAARKKVRRGIRG